MKAHITTLIIALIAGYFGSYLYGTSHLNLISKKSASETDTENFNKNNPNPFQVQAEPDDLKYQFKDLQAKIEELQTQVIELESFQNKIKSNSESNEIASKKIKAYVQPNKEDLINSGITSDIAEDILRRISQQDFRRLELQNLMRRSDSASRRQYSTELRELNNNKISLRSEMDEDAYDQYLFVSGQNNRVKVSSVMSGSPAESSGFQSDDVILSYDNQKILNWPDIRTATTKGEIGSYTTVEILRDGEQMSLMVPRGTLGVKLDAIQIEPEQ